MYRHTLGFVSFEEACDARAWIDTNVKGVAENYLSNNSAIAGAVIYLYTTHRLNLTMIQYLQRGANPYTIVTNEDVDEIEDHRPTLAQQDTTRSIQ